MTASRIRELKHSALQYLQKASMAVGVSDVAKHLNVSWSTARQMLMELLVEQRIKSKKTTKSRIFWITRDDRITDIGGERDAD